MSTWFYSKLSVFLLTLPLTAMPVLLPYKPHGSEELFYIPQTEADFSSTDLSDTTMESTHTGTFNTGATTQFLLHYNLKAFP